jgi:hypothetical protein
MSLFDNFAVEGYAPITSKEAFAQNMAKFSKNSSSARGGMR